MYEFFYQYAGLFIAVVVVGAMAMACRLWSMVIKDINGEYDD